MQGRCLQGRTRVFVHVQPQIDVRRVTLGCVEILGSSSVKVIPKRSLRLLKFHLLLNFSHSSALLKSFIFASVAPVTALKHGAKSK